MSEACPHGILIRRCQMCINAAGKPYTEADLGRAREEATKRMSCGHLQADWIHDDADDLASHCYICTTTQAKVMAAQADAFEKCRTAVSATFSPMGTRSQALWNMFNTWMKESRASGPGYMDAEQQKVREEATLTAAHAQREASAKISEIRPLYTGKYTAECIRTAPLVTSKQAQEWLRNHDELEHKATITAIAEEIAADDLDEPLRTVLRKHDAAIRPPELISYLTSRAAELRKNAAGRKSSSEIMRNATASGLREAHRIAEMMSDHKLPKTSIEQARKSADIDDRIAAKLEAEAAQLERWSAGTPAGTP